MTLLQISDTGQGVFLIPDADGEERSYLLRPCPPGVSVAAWQLTRTDTEASYRVSLDAPGRWSCSCPDEKYRKRDRQQCKHILALQPFRLWLEQYLRPLTVEKAHV